MAEALDITPTASKAEKYEMLLPKVEALVAGEGDLIANLANIAAALKKPLIFSGLAFFGERRGTGIGCGQRSHKRF